MKASELRKTLQAMLNNWGTGEAIRTLLTLIAVAEGQGMTQRALSDRLGLSNSDASTLVRRLRVAGLVDSAIDPTHGSRRLLTLTARGVQVLKQAGLSF
jgi:DNA-binding MarR family transcriptional regulator